MFCAARRYTFAVLAVTSLLACVVSVTLWARSYSGTEYLARRRLVSIDEMSVVTRGHSIAWTCGDVRLSAEEQTYYTHGGAAALPGAPRPPARWERGRLGRGHLGWVREPSGSAWGRLGFARYDTGFESSFASSSEDVIALPAWLPVLAFTALPLAFVVRLGRRRRRRAAGRCAACGYDLRGTPQRCPECGTPATATPSPTGAPT